MRGKENKWTGKRSRKGWQHRLTGCKESNEEEIHRRNRKKVALKCDSFLLLHCPISSKQGLRFKLKYRISGLYQLCSLIRKDIFRNMEMGRLCLELFIRIPKKDNNAKYYVWQGIRKPGFGRSYRIHCAWGVWTLSPPQEML